MGKIEIEARKRRRKGYLQDAVLTTLAVGGIMAWMMLAPNTLQLLGGLTRGKNRFAERAKSSATRLVRKGYVRFDMRDGQKFLQITPQGRAYLEREAQLNSPKPRRWDRKWRLVIFDIPEKRRAVRNKLRATVTRVGFLQLQRSVWVYPYDCEDLITLVKAEMRVGKAILYAIVDTIENEKWILKHFALKR